MDIARCSEDNVIYTAVQFSHLQPETIERKRRLLECPECKGPAFFRRASRSGRAPCFGARPHEHLCSLAAEDVERSDEGIGDEQDSLNNPGNRILIDFNFGAVERADHVDNSAVASSRNRGRSYTGDGARPDAVMHRRLSTLLRTLIESPAFRNSNQFIEVAGRYPIQAKDFFVPLLDVSVSHVGSFRGYWGLISDAKEGANNSYWLNSGGRDNVSFCIGKEDFSNVQNKYKIHDLEDLAGAYILVFGTINESQYGKLYCVIENHAYAAIRLT